MFGFSTTGQGISFADNKLPNMSEAKVSEVFTDFAVSKPWLFHSIANTKTEYNFMYPQRRDLLLLCKGSQPRDQW
ncbi:hypothetical protein K4L44_04195 [Halosquirtibacter laminarini]|uniref:Uncharacterized protein n=1 Tax=Halosquirtibacter laminarini TaxID=3374600 RepID=A0AC61NP60_9BACT|nr:hypothetical protein K4L44_04195 [Prolixibacteraceae bacterium]